MINLFIPSSNATKSKIAYARALRQEGVRFDAINADTLTTHLAAVEFLIKKHGIDASRLANLDEAGATAEKEALGLASSKTFFPRGQSHQARILVFKNESRVTIMPDIFASGEMGRPMFVFKGTKLPHRVVERDSALYRESVVDCLPRRSIVTTREDLAGVDKSNFIRWAELFVEDVADLTKQGRKVLLLYDGYRSHMSLRAVQILRKGNVVAYCLPSHTSGKTQPLDLTVFGAFKHNIVSTMRDISLVNATEPYDVVRLLQHFAGGLRTCLHSDKYLFWVSPCGIMAYGSV